MKSGKTGLKRGLATVLIAIFIFSMFATTIAKSNATTVNANLGTSSYSVVKTGNSEGNGIYFHSEFGSVKEVIDAKEALAVEISREGTVLFKNDGALPLAKSDKITIWGLNSISVRMANHSVREYKQIPMQSTALRLTSATEINTGLKNMLPLTCDPIPGRKLMNNGR